MGGSNKARKSRPRRVLSSVGVMNRAWGDCGRLCSAHASS